MNEFQLHHNLCVLYSHIEPFRDHGKTPGELSELIDQFSSRNYKVAVVGEFKRGKSSLVNALLGTEILPTDILPTTAVINRVVYSTERKIVIYFKNGEVRDSTIEQLGEYATKLDSEKEKFAETIREIIVYYPTVFGQNRIELIDTPGLNDNESMTKTTLDILSDIDTAIVVISATMPLSKTEQGLICELIKQTDIYNLVFAVTFIDHVSDEQDEQDRVVELIKDRISNNTYALLCSMTDDEELREKARRILLAPNVYAVSSKQAIQGFIKGSTELIKKSRFDHFRYDLFATLTANQETDRLLKIKRICTDTTLGINDWIEARRLKMRGEAEAAGQRCAELSELAASSQKYLTETLLALDADVTLEREKIISEVTGGASIETHLKRIFISRLSSLRKSSFCEKTFVAALEDACREASDVMNDVMSKTAEAASSLAEKMINGLVDRYKETLDGAENIAVPQRQEGEISPLSMSAKAIVDRMESLEDECMPFAEEEIRLGVESKLNELERFVSSYRLVAIKYNDEMRKLAEDGILTWTEKKEEAERAAGASEAEAEAERARVLADVEKILDII